MPVKVILNAEAGLSAPTIADERLIVNGHGYGS